MKNQYILMFAVSTAIMSMSTCNHEKEDAPETDSFGLRCISDRHFPVAEGSVDFHFPNGNMAEVNNHWPVGWLVPDANIISKTIVALIDHHQKIPKPAEIAFAMNMTLGEYDFICSRIKSAQISMPWDDPSQHVQPVTFVEDRSAPDQLPFLRFKAHKNGILRSPDFTLQGGKPHFLSLWLRSDMEDGPSPEFIFWYNAGLEDISISFFGLPDTKGEWKRYGLYFRALSDTEDAHFTLHFPGKENAFIEIADFRLRSASETEFSAAYAQDRKKMPEHSILESPDDGKYLAATIAKLEGRLGIPGKPFVIWGAGSSWTNGLDDLEPVRQAILSRFPNAPEIVYRKIVGSGSPYDYIRGWIHTVVLADQPDLIISYTNGSVEALEMMLTDIRHHSTADVIIPSLHFFENENNRLTPEVINMPIFDQIKEVCEKYNAQFVDNRRAIAHWLINNNKQVKDLLSDVVHQNNTGRLLTCENIGRQFVRHPSPAYDPAKGEEKISLAESFRNQDLRFIFSDGWAVVGDRLVAQKAGSWVKFTFSGNRMDLIGVQKPNGGSIEVWVDGKPAREAPAYSISYIRPAITNISHMGFYPRWSNGGGDTGPHGVSLGANIIPQRWNISMIDNEGNYELEGSITRKDGRGNNRSVFTGKSRQIIVDPAVWRHPAANVMGDRWTFHVARCAVDTVKFISDRNNGWFTSTLFQNLPNDKHTVELKATDDGEINIESFYIFTPPLK